MLVAVKGLCKSFGPVRVLDSVAFSVESGELVSIIGPSGVGKTTLLSLIAGLEKPDSGEIRFATPPSRENPVILVFQDYLLFPSMTVFENIAFGLKARRVAKAEISRRVMDQLDYFQLGDKGGLYPAELSAGQKQRVAIARALVVNPSLLLLDEPFANLDRNLKMETANFIRRTQRELNITIISVTHDLEEAFAMSDRMGIMLDGRLAQFGPVAEIYHQPASLEVASFLGPVNRIPARVAGILGLSRSRAAQAPGSDLFARPEALAMEKDPDGKARVLEQTFVGHYMVYQVAVENDVFTVYGLADGIASGDRVSLRLKYALRA